MAFLSFGLEAVFAPTSELLIAVKSLFLTYQHNSNCPDPETEIQGNNWYFIINLKKKNL